MGDWWRSEEMTYVSLIIAESAAPACVSELGALGCLQFTDMNPEQTPFQRRYVNFIKRCDEIERKIRFVNGEMRKMSVEPVYAPASAVNAFVDRTTATLGEPKATGSYLLEDLDGKLEGYEQRLVELNKFGSKLTDEYQAKAEMHHVLTKVRTLFIGEIQAMSPGGEDAHYRNRDSAPGVSLHSLPDSHNIGGESSYSSGGIVNELAFSNIAGVLLNADRVRFERMLFRATRGNCWVRFAPIDGSEILPGDTMTSAAGARQLGISLESDFNKDKTVFMIFFKSKAIQTKIKRICDAFNAHCYDIQSLDRPQDLRAQEAANARDLQDARVVLSKNVESRRKLCEEVATSIEGWLWVVRREKSIYHNLNLFKSSSTSNMLRGRAWIVSSRYGDAQNALNRAHATLNIPTSAIFEPVSKKNWPAAPTHFNTNKYTDAFQEFVNTYGIPRYREINPALFTAATFPFLFGIMYGDIGHGSLLMFFGLFLILTESKADDRSSGEMVKSIYGARYMLFSMGLCAVYAGSVYNDYFSLGLNIFGSNYDFVDREKGADAVQNGAYGDPALVYPYGIDPAWKIADNRLLFFNSFKMKLSVVLGITQMTLGICLKGMNAIYFNQWLDFTCEFIPMIIFDLCFFGYMVILIFIKWSINWQHRMALGTCGYDDQGVLGGCTLVDEESSCFDFNKHPCNTATPLSDMCPLGMGGTSGGCQPPNLITTLMNMALMPGSVDEPLFHGQANLQVLLLLVAFLTVPWLLVVKPYILKSRNEKEKREAESDVKSPLISSTGADFEEHGVGAEYSITSGMSASMMVEDKELAAAGAASAAATAGDSHGHGGEFDFGEIVIHQAIETIEFVLGMVSNTASYLRLWALSLAHSELAEVFWGKALLSTLDMNNPVAIYIGFALFAAVTFAVLCCMDVLECFLHALRLHWVEFQNKFYKADGSRFQPFDFKAIIAKAVLAE